MCVDGNEEERRNKREEEEGKGKDKKGRKLNKKPGEER